jgi:SH3 domain protein
MLAAPYLHGDPDTEYECQRHTSWRLNISYIRVGGVSTMGLLRIRGLRQRPGVLFGLTLFLLLWGETWAENVYLSDMTLDTILRAGPGIEHRIIASVQVGSQVTLVREEKEWAEVALQSGRTGWVLKKYLSKEPPGRVAAEKLAGENKALREEVNQLSQGKQELSDELGKLKKELEGGKRGLASVRQEYETLKKGATEYLNLKSDFDKLTEEATQVREKLGELQRDYDTLQSSTAAQALLSGAGVLILGWLSGFVMQRLRRRRRSDLYR